MAFDIITHGGGEYLTQAFNAIAMFFNGGSAAVMTILMGFTGSIAGLNALYVMISKHNIIYPAKWLSFYIIFLAIATQAPCNIVIRDRVTRLVSSVNNVPFLLAFPASVSSVIGDFMAKKFDQMFASYFAGNNPLLQRVMEYRSMGVAMSSKLIANASFLPVANPEMASNLRAYIGECVLYDLAFGWKYDLDTLLNSKDMWELVSSNPSPHGGVLIRTHTNARVNPPELLSCKEAAQKINDRWSVTEKITEFYFGRKMNPQAKKPGAWLRLNLVSAYNFMTDQAVTSGEILRQNIMRGALIDGFQAASIRAGGNAGQLSNLAYARAKSAQDAAYTIHGGMAQQSVSVMKIVIEVILYSIFPFVCILAALPNNFGIFRTYLISMAWLQSWAPLYSILNMIFAYRAKSLSLAAIEHLVASESGITASTISGLGQVHIDTANYAGFWMMLIPVISWSLFKFGGGAISRAAHSVMGTIISTGESEGRNMAQGTYTQDQVNYSSRSYNTETRHQFNDGANFTSGQSRIQTPNGSTRVVNPAGEFDIAGATHTKGTSATSFRMGVQTAQVYSAVAQKEKGLAINDQIHASNSWQAAKGQATNYLNQLSSRESSGEHWASGSNTNDVKTLNDALELGKTLREQFGVDEQTSNKMVADLSGSFTLGVGSQFGLKKHDVSAEGKGTLNGTLNYTSNSGKTISFGDVLEVAKKKGYNATLSDISDASNKLNYGEDHSKDKQLSDNLSASLQKYQGYRTSQDRHENRAARFNQYASFARTNNSDTQTDCTQAAINWIAKQPSSDGYGNNGMNDAKKIMDATEGSLYEQKMSLLDKFQHEKTKDLLNAVENTNIKNFDELKKIENAVFSGKGPDAVNNFYNQQNKEVHDKVEQEGTNFTVNQEAKQRAEQQLQEARQKVKDREAHLNKMRKQQAGKTADKLEEGTAWKTVRNFFSPITSTSLFRFGSEGQFSKKTSELKNIEKEEEEQ